MMAYPRKIQAVPKTIANGCSCITHSFGKSSLIIFQILCQNHDVDTSNSVGSHCQKTISEIIGHLQTLFPKRLPLDFFGRYVALVLKA